MKPFNLEEALKDPSKVCTRGGRDVKEIVFLKSVDTSYLLPVIYTCEGSISHVSKEGFFDPGKRNLSDLLMKSDKKEGWINIHGFKKPSCSTSSGGIFETKEEAMAAVLKHDFTYKDTVKIEWEE